MTSVSDLRETGNPFADSLLAAGGAAASVAIEHLALWDSSLVEEPSLRPNAYMLQPPWNYIVGMGTVTLWFRLWVLRHPAASADTAYDTYLRVLGSAGMVIIAAWWLRRAAADDRRRSHVSGAVGRRNEPESDDTRPGGSYRHPWDG
jgi:hypothetical protein